MSRRLPFLILGLGLLAGCNEAEQPALSAPAKAVIPYAGPVQYPAPGEPHARAAEFIWAYSGDTGVETLARGLPDGSVIDVIFRCRPEQPAVQYGFFQKGPVEKTVKFGSGSATTSYYVTAAPPEYASSDAWVLSGELKPQDEAFVGFLKSGKFTRWFGEKTQAWDAKSEAESAALAKFSEACKAKI